MVAWPSPAALILSMCSHTDTACMGSGRLQSTVQIGGLYLCACALRKVEVYGFAGPLPIVARNCLRLVARLLALFFFSGPGVFRPNRGTHHHVPPLAATARGEEAYPRFCSRVYLPLVDNHLNLWASAHTGACVWLVCVCVCVCVSAHQQPCLVGAWLAARQD